MNKIAQIRALMDKGMTVKEIIAKGFSASQVRKELNRRAAGVPLRKAGRPPAPTNITKEINKLKNAKPTKLFIQPEHLEKAKALIATYDRKPDAINPDHYKVGGIETADYIEAKQLGYNLGNVVKYVSRAYHKGNPLEDLQKAKWYLERQINNLLPKQG